MTIPGTASIGFHKQDTTADNIMGPSKLPVGILSHSASLRPAKVMGTSHNQPHVHVLLIIFADSTEFASNKEMAKNGTATTTPKKRNVWETTTALASALGSSSVINNICVMPPGIAPNTQVSRFEYVQR